MRKTEFANGEYYHIYNRGVDKREVFLDRKDYERFILGMNEFNDSRPSWKVRFEVSPRVTRGETSNLVELIAYCINPNHYHFILKQKVENGVTDFMRKLGTGYTMYFNKRHAHSGVIFQGPFKSIHIDSNEYLLLLSAYVNANHEIHGFLEKDWPYSSLLDYTERRDGKLCNKEIILGQFDNNFFEYEKYIKNNADYFREKKELEEYILE
ncbi:MAG: hypothetical protein COX29_02985 [Candidatus Moranbacteria bacterium CG23_combo_of_CG06-09_8_20_14_all_35_22]|nr:MAG: hypothetical protein COX29_02985 [Candidatus Moranbacteria bacterium CG23_combo_of_CG06-09_8_20_14_all_35_22]